MARDVSGHLLPAHMETNGDGDEIALVVEDAGARYPIDIDPITAAQEVKLTRPVRSQTGAEFGDAVAISDNVAVIGSWLEDVVGLFDIGQVYVFTRSGSTWSLKFTTSLGSAAAAQCGWTVALSEHATGQLSAVRAPAQTPAQRHCCSRMIIGQP